MLRPIRPTVALLALLLCVSGLAFQTPAAATLTTLCRGYTGCADAGMSNAGYKSNSGTMWWRMYSGHNCTNYAAYRMVRSGLPNIRPWSGSGNASNWGHAMAKITDGTPTVGAVAWWDAYVRPAGSAGHVAYVEKVVSADEIIVSQDSWGGDFSWARITRAGGSWPSGFIHFNDATLTNLTRPSLAGTRMVGQVLTASVGTWSPTATSYAYKWLADGSRISGETGSTLLLTQALEGKRIKVRVTATKPGYETAYAKSPRTAPVAPGAITSTAQPTITGEPRVDATLTASAGSWNPEPTALTYQWAANGKPVAGATAARLAVGPTLVGKTLTVAVTAAKSGYQDVTATSAATAPVAPGTFTVTGEPTLIGLTRLGQTLTVSPMTVTPADAQVAVEWLRSGVPVAGAVGSTYQLTAADLGRRMVARLTVTKPGYTTVVRQTPASRLIKSPATLTLSTTAGSGRLRVAVKVTAPGVDPVRGVVRVRSHGKVLADLVLSDGAASATLRGLAAGRQRFVFRFTGSRTVAVTRQVRVVRIG